MTPVKSGERSRPPRMISCVRSFVCVIQQGTCRGCIARVPDEAEHRQRDRRRAARRAPRSRSCGRRAAAACPSSGARPAAAVRAVARRASSPADRRRAPPRSSSRPTWISPERNVPVVSTTASASNDDADLRDHAGDARAGAVAVERQVVDGLLKQREVRLVLEPAPDRRLVEHAVGLRPRRAHRRALARIERAELDSRPRRWRSPSRRRGRRPP